MNIIHILADGSKPETIDGLVIQSEQFYEVLNGILEKGEQK